MKFVQYGSYLSVFTWIIACLLKTFRVNCLKYIFVWSSHFKKNLFLWWKPKRWLESSRKSTKNWFADLNHYLKSLKIKVTERADFRHSAEQSRERTVTISKSRRRPNYSGAFGDLNIFCALGRKMRRLWINLDDFGLNLGRWSETVLTKSRPLTLTFDFWPSPLISFEENVPVITYRFSYILYSMHHFQ